MGTSRPHRRLAPTLSVSPPPHQLVPAEEVPFPQDLVEVDIPQEGVI